MKQTNPPKRITSTILNALKGGVVPRVGLEYITVGRDREIDALLRDIDIIADGGAAFRFIVGKYGSGKSFLLQTIRNYARSEALWWWMPTCRLSGASSAPRGKGLPPSKN